MNKAVNAPSAKLKAIVAMTDDRVIGNNGALPWHLPEDLKFFKKMTLGGVLVMGRKTYASIGRPLPGRETVVLSRSGQSIAGVVVVDSIDAVMSLVTDKTMWVVGGAEIYSQLLPYCSELYLTRVCMHVEGDTFFPAFEHYFEKVGLLAETSAYKIEHYRQSQPVV
jgi:dihydrofolate reductase